MVRPAARRARTRSRTGLDDVARWPTVANKDDELRGLARGGRIPREGNNAARRAPFMRTKFASLQGIGCPEGTQSLLVGVSRKASAESPKGRDPPGARCAARNASGARHSGFRASPGNAPRLFVCAFALDAYGVGGTLAEAIDLDANSA
ncbi:conserved protein of unknown function (plasmid) [Paraburkholderia dioscoreae]|uniref:Uncharacterized protein n=1 Tax=Paraburkholderia dioscoreae TaxID=2604047 RepID=A0A5Q4ZHV7_9BURK|nr:conserved protein of unknown function [Paraburkholderia dioscoreae]